MRGTRSLFFFIVGWLGVTSVGGLAIGGFTGFKIGATFGVLTCISLIIGFGVRSARGLL